MTTTELASLRHTLRRRFGFKTLREGQEEVIRSVMAGQDTLAIMPTGAGKSLCYQLPGSQLAGTTVVVSPLISLMKDQVDKMADLGLAAAQVNSAVPSREASAVLERIAAGRAHDFVYVTPERIAKPEFLARLRRNRIGLFVIDEAHCLSEWGHDFRPAYLRLRQAIAALGEPTVLALTATATERVVDDIRRQLGREEMAIVDTGVYRQNLHPEVHVAASEEGKREPLLRLLREGLGCGIIYTSTVRDCEAVAAMLTERGHTVAAYHGRMRARERTASQDRFMAGELEAIVATNAFGMGIDKPDIRFVVHYNLPGSLEAYYQESGRAGRDGEPARCVLIYLPQDRNTQLFLLNGRYPKAEHFAAAYRALQRLGAGERAVSASQVHEQAPLLAKSKLRVVLAMLAGLGLADEPRAGRYRLLRGGLGARELDAMAREYRRRAKHDRERLRRMVIYAQTRLCRWKALLDYFDEALPNVGEGGEGGEGGEDGESGTGGGGGEVGGVAGPGGGCGHCDNCSRPL